MTRDMTKLSQVDQVEHDYAPRPAAYRRPRRSTGHTSRMFLLFVSLVLVGNALLGERGLPALVRANREIAGLSTLIDGLRSENAALRRQVRALRHEPRAIEDLARRELGLIRPGERLFILGDAAPGPVPRAASPDPPADRGTSTSAAP